MPSGLVSSRLGRLGRRKLTGGPLNFLRPVFSRVVRKTARGPSHQGVGLEPETLCDARRAPGRHPR